MRRRVWLLWASTFVAALLLGLLLSFVVERYAGQGKILRGVLLEDRPVTGLGEQALRQLLHRRQREIRSRKISLSLREETLEAGANELGAIVDSDAGLRRLLGAGRTGHIPGQMLFWLARLFSPYRAELPVRVEQPKLTKWLKPRAEKILPTPLPPRIFFDKELVVDKGRAGAVVEFAELGEDLKSALRRAAPMKLLVPVRELDPTVSPEDLEARRKEAELLLNAPIQLRSPEGEKVGDISVEDLGAALGSEVSEEKRSLRLTLSVESLRASLKKILADLEKPAQNAGFEFGPAAVTTILPSATGLALDESAFIQAIFSASREPERAVTVPLVVTEPKISTAKAETLGVKELVSSFVTMHQCCQPRVENIHTAAAQLDGVVLEPGETFSLNKLLGQRSASSGYLGAPTIVRGKMEDVSGGGISQLATTLFNAVLRGGYEIVQRQPHSIYFSRYPEGHEATVSFPEPDLIFRNDTSAGMVIKTEYTGTFIKVLVYGDGEGRVVSVNKSGRYDVKKPPIEYEADPNMPPEKQKRVRAGQLGWTVLVSRTVKYKDGEKKVEKREVTYSPRPELMRVHPCKIPKGEDGHTGEECPEPPREEEEEELSDDEYFETTIVDDPEGG